MTAFMHQIENAVHAASEEKPAQDALHTSLLGTLHRASVPTPELYAGCSKEKLCNYTILNWDGSLPLCVDVLLFRRAQR